jgi:hypothetical protein
MSSKIKNMLLLCGIVCCWSTAQSQAVNDVDSMPISKNINVNYMIRGYFYAASSIKDTNAFGGFGGSYNYPKPVNDKMNIAVTADKVLLYIDTFSKASFASGYEGFKMFVTNVSKQTIAFPASDSRLSMIAEVFTDGKWQPIEYLPSSWCGNSYHTVFLQAKEYWEFTVPKYYGKHKVQLRYRLQGSQKEVWYSNEIIAFINKKQLTEKQGHSPNGIMDPYND